MPDKIKKTKNNKKNDERFNKVNINHDPQAESARAVTTRDGDDKFK